MPALLIYTRRHDERAVRAVTEEEARQEIRTDPGLYPWRWLGLLFAGLPVTTESAVYALSRQAAQNA